MVFGLRMLDPDKVQPMRGFVRTDTKLISKFVLKLVKQLTYGVRIGNW